MANLTISKLGTLNSFSDIVSADSLENVIDSIETRLSAIKLDSEDDIQFLHDSIQKIIYKFGGEVPDPIHYDNETYVILNDGSKVFFDPSKTDLTEEMLKERSIDLSSVTDIRFSSSLSAMSLLCQESYKDMTQLTSVVGPSSGSISSLDNFMSEFSNLVFLKLPNGLTSLTNSMNSCEKLRLLYIPMTLVTANNIFTDFDINQCNTKFSFQKSYTDYDEAQADVLKAHSATNVFFGAIPGIEIEDVQAESSSSALKSGMLFGGTPSHSHDWIDAGGEHVYEVSDVTTATFKGPAIQYPDSQDPTSTNAYFYGTAKSILLKTYHKKQMCTFIDPCGEFCGASKLKTTQIVPEILTFSLGKIWFTKPIGGVDAHKTPSELINSAKDNAKKNIRNKIERIKKPMINCDCN